MKRWGAWSTVAGLALGLWAAPVAAGAPERAFEELFGAEARKVSASYDKADDAAFA